MRFTAAIKSVCCYGASYLHFMRRAVSKSVCEDCYGDNELDQFMLTACFSTAGWREHNELVQQD